ncbi:MAG TPA: hypothetical protein VGM88_12620 [Kofleriaceae bacterium]|jgi:hypothetical protein
MLAVLVTHLIAVHLHVAPATASDDWVQAQLRVANEKLAPLDVSLTFAATDDAAPARIETRAARDALDAGLTAGAIDVFVTGYLQDLDAARGIYGVTWHHDGHTYLILSAEAWPRTFAHELGHFFGLPHSDDPASLMNADPPAEPPPDSREFLPGELRVMRATRNRLLRRKAI